jgi:CDP-alcohol phosphatidyltransferase
MLDRQMLALTKPLVEDLARRIHQAGYSANQVSFAGFGFGVVSALMIASGFVTSAVIPLLINRMCDGLDGAIARRISCSTPASRWPLLFAILKPTHCQRQSCLQVSSAPA